MFVGMGVNVIVGVSEGVRVIVGEGVMVGEGVLDGMGVGLNVIVAVGFTSGASKRKMNPMQ